MQGVEKEIYHSKGSRNRYFGRKPGGSQTCFFFLGAIFARHIDTWYFWFPSPPDCDGRSPRASQPEVFTSPVEWGTSGSLFWTIATWLPKKNPGSNFSNLEWLGFCCQSFELRCELVTTIFTTSGDLLSLSKLEINRFLLWLLVKKQMQPHFGGGQKKWALKLSQTSWHSWTDVCCGKLSVFWDATLIILLKYFLEHGPSTRSAFLIG